MSSWKHQCSVTMLTNRSVFSIDIRDNAVKLTGDGLSELSTFWGIRVGVIKVLKVMTVFGSP
ncbi:hypothetical protein [Endozoicomonas numazuensis]|uniref:hypothetical protein n=1 Tax=Endozoicomonas numazuensis TaxID=1137799 RepID=UPI001F26D763|nr:hypothetical protein [Endozoicomonas numazuensis]